MRRHGEWMQLPTDDRLLETLSTGLTLTPQVIAKNIDKSRVHVTRRLAILVGTGFVTWVERGYYEITDRGERYLDGERDADEFDPESYDS